jgi:simple sugar transport system permease protein
MMEKFILKYFNLIRTIIAILIGFVISISLILLVSKDSFAALGYLFLGPFGSVSRMGNIIELATPIIFCGIAIAIPFQASQFNVGAEGTFFISAAFGTAFALIIQSLNLPGFIYVVVVLAFAGLMGALWGFIPGFLKAKYRANMVVLTLMLNYIAYFISIYLINYHFRDKSAGFLTSYRLPDSVFLKQIIPNTRIHIGFLISIAAVFIAYYFLYHTTLGYEIRMVGFNFHFAKYSGIDVFKVIVLSSMIGGIFAGIGGMSEVMGIHRRFLWQSLPGYGWDGVVVAIIGRNNPILIMFAAFFLAYLRIGGQVLNLLSDVPYELVSVIEAIIILLITAEAFLENIKYRITVKEAEKEVFKNESPS